MTTETKPTDNEVDDARMLWDRAETLDGDAAELVRTASAHRRNAVRILRAAGLSLRAAGDVLGVSRTTIAKYDVDAT